MVVVLRAAADAVASFRVAGAGAVGPIFEDQDQSAVGKPGVECEGVDFAHRFDPETSSAPLIGERAVDEAVGNDPAASLQRRPNGLVDMIGARGGEQQG